MLALALIAALAAVEDQGVVEQTVVKHRLFTVQGRAEGGLSAGFTMVPKLTDHTLFDATVAYNLYESLAVEGIGGWAYSRPTALANDLTSRPVPSGASDFSDLWVMKGHFIAGLRWQPIYGKLGLFSEALHFQFFGWLGAGGAYFTRDAIVGGPLHREQAGPLFSAAIGARFFLSALGDHHALRVEVRDFSWLDSFTSGGRTATGVTNLVQVNVGYTFVL